MALGVAAQNLGIVCQLEGQAALDQGDRAAAQQRFAQAEGFLRESLNAWVQTANEPNEAASAVQLGQLYRLMGRLDEAEQYAQRARQIGERLGDLRGLSITYQTLKDIARTRGDQAAADEWAAKEREVNEELARRARGGREPAADRDDQLLQLLRQLTIACVQASASGVPLPREANELLDQLTALEAGPLAELGQYLRALSTASESALPALVASPPAATPAPLRDLLAQLERSLRE